MEKDFSSPEYQRSRVSYLLFCMFEYFVSILVADVFLATLLSSLEFKDGDIGIISSFISLAFVFQMFSLLLARKRGSKKTIILVMDVIGQMLFLALYALPFLNIDPNLRRALVYVFIIGAYMCKYLVSTFLFQWANSYVDPNKRASYSGNKEIISLIGGIIFSLAMGAIFDYLTQTDNLLEKAEKLKVGFLFLAIVILLCNLCTFLCLLLIKRERVENKEQIPRKKISDIIKNTFGNKNFRHLVIIAIIWKCAQYFTIGFMGTFKADDKGYGLALSVFAVQAIAMVANIVRMLVTRPFGKYSDKHSFASGFYLSMFIAVAAFLCNTFTTRETWFLVIGYTVLHAISAAGNGQNAFNMTYSYVDSNYIAEALALQNCISGVCGFACSVIAGKILDAIQAAGNTFLGIPMFGQQLLGLISALLCGVCIIYMRLTIMKEKVMKQ